MPLGKIAGLDQLADRRRQVEEPQQIRHGRPVLADGPGDLGLLHSELLRQGLVPLGLFQWVQGLPLEVLDQRQDQKRLVVGLSNDDRRLGPFEGSEGAEASLPRHQLESVRGGGRRPHHEGLQEAVLPDRGGQVRQLRFGEDPPRLHGIGDDGRQRHCPHLALRDLRVQIVAKERPQTPPQPVPAHRAAPADTAEPARARRSMTSCARERYACAPLDSTS